MALAEEPVHPIHQAAKDGDLEMLKRSGKKDLNKPDSEDGWTAVHWCSWRGDAEALSIVLNRGGDPNKPDQKGCTPLHVAATYGSLQAIQMLVEHKANIYALDNRGNPPAKVSSMNKRMQCCRFLDNLSIQMEVYNKDYVKQQQAKSLKDLEKRLKEVEKLGTGSRAVKNYSTKAALSMNRANSDSHVSKRRASAEEAARQNFVLQQKGEREGPEESVDSLHQISDSFLSFSGSGSLRPLPRHHSGAILNNLSDLAKRPITADDLKDSGSDPTFNSTKRHSRDSQISSSSAGRALGRIIPLQNFQTENDSEMVTFLQSLNLLDAAQVMVKERMDMDALSLCSEEDLRGIGLGLGPRLKIMHALEQRKEVIKTPPLLTDSEL